MAGDVLEHVAAVSRSVLYNAGVKKQRLIKHNCVMSSS